MTRHPYTMPGVLALLFAGLLALVALAAQPDAFVAPGIRPAARPVVVTLSAEGP